jgi:uncharacterized membrane protein
MKEKQISELENAGILDLQTADRIRAFYRAREEESTPKIFVIFGVLGAVLVGLGVISIFAHNWDELPRFTKTILAFIPLIIGQIACGYTLLKKRDSIAWRESSSMFLFITIGASISLVSQIYNIPGNISSFLLTWLLLALPLIYLLNSSVVSLFYWVGVVWYGCETNYFHNDVNSSHLHWLVALLALPHYYLLCKNKPESNFTNWHHWFIAIAGLALLGTIAKSSLQLLFPAYFSLFALYLMSDNLPFFKQYSGARNGYFMLGALGTITLLFVSSFHDFWIYIWRRSAELSEILSSREFISAVVLTILAIVLLIRQRQKDVLSTRPLEYIFLLFALIFAISYSSPKVVVLINILLLVISILTIKDGLNHNRLSILNFGLIILTVLVLCRFSDTDLSFTLKGIISILLGIGFFAANYYTLRKNKSNGL